jgi:anaerobic selenocysteine-containing dehydrogenase
MAGEMETPGRGQVRGFVCFAGNPVLSTPDGPRLGRALAGLDYMMAVDFYLTETARHAHLVLPPAHVFESSNFNLFFFGLAVRNLVRYDPPILPKSGRDDWEIAAELALRLRLPAPLATRLSHRMRDLPDRVVDWLLRRRGLSLAKLAAHPHGLDLGPLRPCLGEKVHTPDGRARLAPAPLVAEIPRVLRWLDEPRQLVLIGRRHLRSNNSWMHNLRSLTKGPARAQLLMHPDDAGSLSSGARVRVKSAHGSVDAELAVSDSIAPGVVSLSTRSPATSSRSSALPS